MVEVNALEIDGVIVTVLPCPFCGRSPVYGNRPSDHTETGEWHHLSCFCGSYTSKAWQGAESLTELVRAWNTRIPSWRQGEGKEP